MQKADARKWNYLKESFQDYALDKLVLIKNLKLPETEIIHLLINGIASSSLRELAAVLKVTTVDEFLEEMHRITLASGEPGKKQSSPSGKPIQKSKNTNESSEKNVDQLRATKDLYCVYCRNKGHLRADCFRLKRKEQLQQPTNPVNASTPVSAVEEDATSLSAVTPSTTVASVKLRDDRNLVTTDSSLTVVELNNTKCKLIALLDSGSPISFVRPSIYKKYFDIPINFLQRNSKDYTAVNSTPIRLLGSITSTLKLEALSRLKAKVSLNVLNEDTLATDLILGLDFFYENSITFQLCPKVKQAEDRLKLFSEVVLAETDNIPNSIKSILSKLLTI
ncbi:uncharacterized protein LOC118646976 [Monomorium pharaonis]|uniref:uncharacterized protein LOC118646976 n=1 Tax=Monomorium pharaonis TaxID=307658 RepID=UPI001746EF9B|nr:uncharacterized protein LOC118646976 [Monomorium pharaonis]